MIRVIVLSVALCVSGAAMAADLSPFWATDVQNILRIEPTCPPLLILMPGISIVLPDGKMLDGPLELKVVCRTENEKAMER